MDYALEMLREQDESASKARAAEIVQRVKNLHVDEMSVGVRVSFVKKFSGSKEYTFLALKTHDIIDGIGMDRWYVTNRRGALTNGEFEELLAEKLGFENFELLYPSASLKVSPPDYIKMDTEIMNPPLRDFNRQARGTFTQVGPRPSPLSHAIGEEMDGEEDPK